MSEPSPFPLHIRVCEQVWVFVAAGVCVPLWQIRSRTVFHAQRFRQRDDVRWKTLGQRLYLRSCDQNFPVVLGGNFIERVPVELPSAVSFDLDVADRNAVLRHAGDHDDQRSIQKHAQVSDDHGNNLPAILRFRVSDQFGVSKLVLKPSDLGH